MNKELKALTQTMGLIVGCVLLLMVSRCKEEPLVYTTSSNVNITTYLEKYPEKFSEFSKILTRSNTDGFLQAYGSYTIFLPTNDAIKAYLTKIGKSSVDQIDAEELKKLVSFHVINDTVSTGKFGDGKINALTMYGQYLTTGNKTVGGQTYVTINRQANITKPNIRVGNGIIHEIDNVLEPATLTVAAMIEANPDYSIFNEALKATGLYDTLNVLPAVNPDKSKKWLTVLVQPNSVFKDAGFNDFVALKNRYSKTGDPTKLTDSLNAFVRYHILFDAKYLSDIGSASSHSTLALSEIITSKLVDQKVLINDLDFNGSYEPGIALDRTKGDLSASNGVLQVTAPYVSAAGTTTGHFAIKVRNPIPVYWDVADFPEIRTKAGYWRAKEFNFFKETDAHQPIAGWNWERRGDKYGHKYKYDATTNFVYGDFLHCALGIPTAANPGSQTNAWMYMKTPVLVKGKYKVWICYQRREQTGKWPTGRRTQCQVKIDNDVMVKPFDFAEPPPTGTMKELESQGWKYYTAAPVVWTASATNVYVGKMVGIVDIKSTNNHTIRLDVIQGNSGTDYMDMIHFIPVDAPSQILPRFRKDGSEDYTDIP